MDSEVMTQRELVESILHYEDLHDEITALEKRIIETVLYHQETQKIGRVTARYSEAGNKYDWEGFIDELPKDDEAHQCIKAHTKPSTSWSKAAKALGYKENDLKAAGFWEKTPPRVAIKVSNK